MKFRCWFEQYKKIPYAEYKELGTEEQNNFIREYQCFMQNIEKQNRLFKRPMSQEEKTKLEAIFAKEKMRYEISKKIGGIDECGNYTALHHRWEE